ncbi:nucleoid associated protein NdpA [Hydrogenispora ethanolica]|uniref:Nucleoid associated protein NdpA n=1 Tax=Hydrogenispora ethanolica TaxID=1082276 RepID=A0A4R1RIM6_HYDET|nr:nucleoid-associated protein [Hydrogenispora ethanolica]TCL65951.1 nucleoid associated protein NdpA [Hydrogenispora ethanolica]
MAEIIIEKAVLHILDTNVGLPVLSQQELELKGEAADFLEKQLRKVLEDDRLKPAEFSGEANPVRERCAKYAADGDFLGFSQGLADALYRLMLAHVDISPADLVCCHFSEDGRSCFGALKLNYRKGFIHQIGYEEERSINSLVLQQAVLPSEQQKPEECFVVALDDLSLRLIEKEYEIDGNKELYLSKRFLACADRLSNHEKARVLDKVTQKISQKYGMGDDFTPMVRLRQAVSEDLDDAGAIDMQHVAQAVFRGDPDAQREYLEEVHRAGLVERAVELPERIANRKFRNQKIWTDTGIEINFPADYYNNREKLEFVSNVDGTISIIIKNVGKIINK